MEEALFTKHLIEIKKQKNNKKEVILIVKEKTGIVLKEKEVFLSKKEVVFHVSSVKRSKITQKRIIEILKQEGYVLKG